MAGNKDAQDYKEYQDYLEYQKYASSPAYNAKTPSIGEQAVGYAKKAGMGLLKGAETVAEYADRYTGAPVRSAVGSLQDDLDLSKAAGAYKKQFGRPTEYAPTGKDLAEKAGVPGTSLSEKLPGLYSETGEGLPLKKGGLLDPTLSGTVGVAIGAATDPINYIPLEAAFKAVGTGVQKAAPRVVETLSGVPAQKTANYIEDIKGVNKKIAEHSGDIGSASDATKRSINQQILTGKGKLNTTISEELKSLPTERTISNAPIIERLQAERAKLRPETNPSALKEIDEHISVIKSLGDDLGNMNAKDLFDAKQYLQKVGQSAYKKDGQIFVSAAESAKAAKAGGAVSRKVLNSIAPKIKEANNQLSLLHDFEDNLIKNLIKEHGSERDLIIAGSNKASRQRKSLELLDKVLGSDTVKQAKDLSAFSAYAKPGLVPLSNGTTSTTRTISGLAGGLLLGGGKIDPALMIPAAAATSPIVHKGLLNAAIPASNALKNNAADLEKAIIAARLGAAGGSAISKQVREQK